MFRFPEELIQTLETPCLVVDEAQARRNIERVQALYDSLGVRLRPHVKTHKMPYFARLQEEAGSSGITSCKVSEAEVMAEGGMQDIFIAYPLVGPLKIARAIRLHSKIRRLILAVDSPEQARALEEAATDEEKRRGQPFSLEVRVEVDTGAKRTGVSPAARKALFEALLHMSHLKVTGIYTFKGLTLEGAPTEDNEAAGREEAAMLSEIREEMLAMGFHDIELSGGSTPTGEFVARSGLVDEVRPGTYVFGDYMLTKERCAAIEDIAVRCYATVVSVPREDYAVIDGGTKTFPMDITPNTPPAFYPGYAVVEGREDLQLLRMNEEHGILTSTTGLVGLKVGQVIPLIPIHVCPAVNLQNEVYVYDGNTLRKEAVLARGKLV